MSKILLIVAQKGFQTKEYHDPKRVLESAGHTVVTGSIEKGVAISNIGEEVVVDIAIANVDASAYDAVFLIGGPGALAYLDNAETIRIVRDAALHGELLYGAICVSPRILARAGVLSGKHATGWNGDGELPKIFITHGVLYEQQPVVVDGRVITADGPMSGEAFGHAINEFLKER